MDILCQISDYSSSQAVFYMVAVIDCTVVNGILLIRFRFLRFFLKSQKSCALARKAAEQSGLSIITIDQITQKSVQRLSGIDDINKQGQAL